MARSNTQASAAATSYAKALLELANEQNIAEPLNGELQALREALIADPQFGAFLRDPGIGQDEKLGVLNKALASARPILRNFVGVLARHDRLGLLVETADAYDDLLGQQLGKVEVDVTVAQKLTPDQLEQIRRQVSQALGKDAVIHPYVDESIIGGLVLRVQDRLIDASVKAQLDAMRRKLLSVKPGR